ncbi:uncharacterized protein LOC105428420 isoform X1 [Pogonomyrmex barbatus]|uniref:Uncharacterized protein LOC105428420 isoform X1 n=1 Tax=Pogonomyrmex barbatus TaxID=144034 RepID=A0A6I9WDQ5_9HYME|nr:uncharacterized protein LOC105428420 isoform X1 [Pogonomyrmex barbatus]
MVLLAIRTIFAIFRKRKVAAVSFQRIIGTTRDTDLRAHSRGNICYDFASARRSEARRGEAVARRRDARVSCEPQLRDGANCAFCEGGAGSERRVRSRARFPGNRVFPGLRHGFPLTRLTLAPVIVDDATATLTD